MKEGRRRGTFLIGGMEVECIFVIFVLLTFRIMTLLFLMLLFRGKKTGAELTKD